MLTVVMCAQFAAIVLLFALCLYVCFQRPSRTQVMMLVILVSVALMLVGYTVELRSTTVEQAMDGVAFSYIGKPFAMLASLLFIMEYCGKKLSSKWILLLALFNVMFPVVIYTNELHHLYYSSIAFDRSRVFSPLTLGHGPLYFVYMAKVVVNFILTMIFTIKEYRRSKTPAARQQVLLLFGMIFSSVVGYLMFLTGLTEGYDTTVAGTTVSVLLLIALFSKYRLFDAVSLAQEHALDHATGGLLVLNARGKKVYSNAMIESLLAGTFTMDELMELPLGSCFKSRDSRYFEIKKENIISGGHMYGVTIEMSDVTVNYNYSTQLEREVESRTREIERIQRSVLISFAGIVEARDNSTGAHIKRMSRFVEILAEDLLAHGDYSAVLNEEYIHNLVDVAPLHDIGKLCIPDSILLKPGRLTAEEFEVIKTHTVEGGRIVRECLENVEKEEYVALAEQVAMYHHEKWNGTGYPSHLSGNDIPLAARITSVADVYDAVRSERCYKPPFSLEEARGIILEGRGTQFDPLIVEAFVRCLPMLEQL